MTFRSWTLLLLLLPCPGCFFSERSFPYKPYMRVEIDSPAVAARQTLTTRQWLAHAGPELAPLLATAPNANMAAILLPSGGHIGFGPYAPDWYYSLILGYFDPHSGAAGRPTADCVEQIR